MEAKVKILIVEDESIVAMELQDRLQKMGYDVAGVADSGDKAIAMTHETGPDLILMDIILKGEKDGIETAKIIRSKLDVPVIFLTAHSDPKTLARAQQEAPYGYVLKPFKERELQITIEMALQRHKVERKLAESEEKYRSFIEHFNGIAFQMGMDYKPIFMNGAIEEITGYSEKDFLSQNPTWDKIIHPDDFKMMMAAKAGKSHLPQDDDGEQEYRIVCKDGKIRWVHSILQIIYDDSGKPLRMQGVVNDIGEKKMIEAELIRSQKLESLGVLAGGIAHDFNNLLTAIFGNIGLAKVFMQPEEKSYMRLNEAEKALGRAKDLTQQLLVFSKGGAPVLQTIDITDVISTSAAFALRGSNVNFIFEHDPNLCAVDFDEGQLSQVIQNLVINADQAMPDGGTVSIRCKNIVLKEDDSIRPNGNYVQIVISDEGTGILPENLKNIFDPYFTTKDHGTGLGLATIYSIIKNHNAHISVDSVVGKGTSFEILIPASDSPITKPGDDGELESLKGQGRVLVMDDQDIILDYAEMALSEFGYQVGLALNGTEAIEKYKAALVDQNPYDLLIMDLTVPGGIGGKEALVELLKIDPNVKAIVSSGYSGNPVMSEYKKYGFCAVLKKPFKIQELGKIVKDVISDK